MKTLLLIVLMLLAGPAFADRSGGGGSGNGGGASAGGASAGGAAGHEADSDHDRARSAVERDEILPLSRLLPELQKRYGGRVIKLELETDHGRYLYEMRLITPEGRIIEVEVDAATGLPVKDAGKRGDRNEDD